MAAKNRSRFIINDVTEIPQKKRKQRKQRTDKGKARHKCVFCGLKFVQIEVFTVHARHCQGKEKDGSVSRTTTPVRSRD